MLEFKFKFGIDVQATIALCLAQVIGLLKHLQLVACALLGSGKSRAVHQLPSPRQLCGVALAPGGSRRFSAAGWVPARFGTTQVAA